MDNLSFPLICPDWNADEEMLLLEAIDMYGFGNWTEVAEYVGTKSKSQCIDHYNAVYMNSSCFPLPDLSNVMGKSREELLAMAEEHCEEKKEFPSASEFTVKEEPSFFAGTNSEESKKQESTSQFSSGLTSGTDMVSISGKTHSTKIKKSSNVTPSNGVKVEESQADRRISEKKPKLSGEDVPTVTEFSGYNFKREEFEIEYDNDAEQILADMEFKDTDTEEEHELKLQVLRIYSKRLDERKRRKDFILQRNLLYPDPFIKSLSPEERELCQRYKVFMQFQSKEEHEELLQNIIEEYRLVKRIQDLQEARAAGCQTAAEAHKFIERAKENEQNTHRDTGHAGTGAKTLHRPNNPKGELDISPRGVHKETSKDVPAAIQAISRSLHDWDVSEMKGAELLSESEKRLCNEIRILPTHYLNMLRIMSLEISKGGLTKKSDAHPLFKVESSKVDRVYDMLVEKGMAHC